MTHTNRLLNWHILAMLCISLLLCNRMWAAEETVRFETATASPAAGDTYRINRGDELNFRFFFAPELNTVVTVRADGFVSLPLVGDLKVDGQRVTELSARVEQLLSAQVRRPQVSINVQNTPAQRVFIGGEVTRPGVQPLVGTLTVLSAIMVAEGLKDTAQPSKVLVLRQNSKGQRDVITVNLEVAMNGKDPAQDMLLQPQDVVVVPRSGIANVGLWVDQYIRRVSPFSLGLTYSINSNTAATQ
jgi:polysaccharide biosynthesis/export protein